MNVDVDYTLSCRVEFGGGRDVGMLKSTIH